MATSITSTNGTTTHITNLPLPHKSLWRTSFSVSFGWFFSSYSYGRSRDFWLLYGSFCRYVTVSQAMHRPHTFLIVLWGGVDFMFRSTFRHTKTTCFSTVDTLSWLTFFLLLSSILFFGSSNVSHSRRVLDSLLTSTRRLKNTLLGREMLDRRFLMVNQVVLHLKLNQSPSARCMVWCATESFELFSRVTWEWDLTKELAHFNCRS